MLEEEKISAYYSGGKLYASYDRMVSAFWGTLMEYKSKF